MDTSYENWQKEKRILEQRLHDAIEEHQSEVSQRHQANEHFEQQQELLKMKMARLETELEKARGGQAGSGTEVNDLKRTVSELKHMIEQESVQKEHAQTEATSSQKQLRTLKDNYDRLLKEKDSAESRINLLEAELDRVKTNPALSINEDDIRTRLKKSQQEMIREIDTYWEKQKDNFRKSLNKQM